MDHLQEVLDLSIVFTQPTPGLPPEILAHVAVQCDALGLRHTGEIFTDPLTKAERDDLHWYLEEYWQWPYLEFAARGRRVEALMHDVGKCLYHALFGNQKARTIIQAWQQQANVQRQISIVSEIASVLRLPWELLADSQGFLVLHADHPISLVRRLPTQGEQTSLSTPFQSPLRILLVTARPEDAGFVDPRSISHELVDELQRQSEAGTIELEFLRPPTFPALHARLKNAERPIHVLHFDGHGELDSGVQQGILLFETKAGKQSPVKASDVAKVLSSSGVRLVVLTACQSAMNTEDDAFSSVSTHLIKNGMDAVIAMSSSILVTSAALYVEAFYHALAEGLPVSIAQELARQALQRDPHRHLFRRRQDEEAAPVTLADWWVPHFYQQRSLTLRATTAPRKHAPLPPNTPVRFNDAMPPEPRYHFSGRARELLQIERSLLRQRLVVLSGFGGIGKTALVRESADWLTRTGLYTSACFVSFEHGGDASLLLSTLGVFLGVQDGGYNPTDPNAALARLQPALAARPTLVIADNLESILPTGDAPLERAARSELWHILRELASSGAGVLLTSRDPLTGEDQLTGPQVATLPLSGLTPTDAYALATRLLEDLAIPRTHAPYAELRDLLHSLDHHPLAIQLVLPALRDHSLASIRTDFAHLLPTFVDDTATGRNRSLLASLDYSLRRLRQKQRAFLPRLAIFEGGASEDDLLAITQIPEETWAVLRPALEQAALLQVEQVHGVPFLHFHPVLIPFLRQEAGIGGGEEMALRQRYAQRYAGLAAYLEREAFQHPEPVYTLVRRELLNLRKALELLLQTGAMEDASLMAAYLARFLTDLGLSREREHLRRRVEQALAAASGSAEGGLTRAEYLHEVGRAQDERDRGNVQAAFARLTSLLARIQALPEGAEDGPGSYAHCRTLQELGRCLRDAGQLEAALGGFREALAVLEALLEQQPEDRSRRTLHANLLRDLGDVLTTQGKYAQAQACYEHALQGQRAIQDTYNEAVTLGQLGYLALQQQGYSQARSRYLQALEQFRAMGEPAQQSIVWHQLGVVAQQQQAWAEAERCCRESLALKERLGDTAGAARTCNLLAIVAKDAGRPAEAEGWYKGALERIERVEPDGMPHASYLHNLANLLVNEVRAGRAARSRLVEARQYAEQARRIMEQPGISAEVWKIYATLAEIAELEEQPDMVRDYRRRERESFAAFAGNRYQIDRQPFAVLVAAIVSAARGDTQAQAAVEAALPQLEEGGWHVSDAVQRIWQGERDWQVLANSLRCEDALLILRVLETLAALRETTPAQPTAEALFASLPTLVQDAIQKEDEAAFDQALVALAPAEQQRVLAILQALRGQEQEGKPEQGT